MVAKRVGTSKTSKMFGSFPGPHLLGQGNFLGPYKNFFLCPKKTNCSFQIKLLLLLCQFYLSPFPKTNTKRVSSRRQFPIDAGSDGIFLRAPTFGWGPKEKFPPIENKIACNLFARKGFRRMDTISYETNQQNKSLKQSNIFNFDNLWIAEKSLNFFYFMTRYQNKYNSDNFQNGGTPLSLSGGLEIRHGFNRLFSHTILIKESLKKISTPLFHSVFIFHP